MSVLCVVPWWFCVTPGASCPFSPQSSSKWHQAILGAFAHLSLHCDSVLSPEAIVTLCPLMGQRQACDFWPFLKGLGRQKLGWGWGLPAWMGAGVGVPRAALKHLRVPSPPWEGGLVLQDGFERGSAVSIPLWWPCCQRGLYPCVMASLGGTGKLCPICARQRDRVSHVVSLPSILAVAESSRAEQTPGPAPACHGVCPVGVPVLSVVCRRCNHETKSSLWCVKWPNPDCCKIN